MNYEKLYFAFIKKYKNQVIDKGVYTEKHHIIPRHAGGDDSRENLIVLDYRQHTFAHRLLWKAYKKPSDYCAWILMSRQESDRKLAIIKANGKANVESGLLARIRPLANNEAQRAHAKKLCEERVLNGEHAINVGLANVAWIGQNHTEEWKANKALQTKVWYLNNLEHYENMRRLGKEAKTKESKTLSENLIKNAERNEEFLQELSSRSKNKFISPEGLEFDSPIFAAKYYGNVEAYIIENWCKRNQHGWSRKPKAV